MHSLSLNLLGRPQVSLNEAPVTGFATTKAEALLYYLACMPGAHPREELADLLWGETPEMKARRSLTQALSSLRKLIGDLFIVDRLSVGLDEAMISRLDVAIFEAVISANKGTANFENLGAAVELYRGDFLEGLYIKEALAFEEWQLSQRERLRVLMLATLDQLVAAFVDRPELDIEAGLIYARRLLELDPWRGSAHRQMMRLLARSGQREAALAQYEICRQILAEELGVEPTPETTALYEQIRAGTFDQAALVMPAQLASPSFLAASPAQSAPAAPFVARQQELAHLQAQLDQALAGQSRVVFISGEAGRGKTSLLAAFARQAQLSRSDLIVAAGVCSVHGDIGDPYLPFRDVLALLTGDLEAYLAAGAISPEQARRLWAFLPQTLQAILEHGPTLLNTLAPGPALVKRVAPYITGQPDWLVKLQDDIEQQQARPGQLEQGQLFEQTRQVFQALAVQQPLLLLFDDLQWIDTASLNLLFHLGRRLDGGRILIVGAYRASEVTDTHPLGPVITEFKRRLGDIQLDLEQIDPLVDRRFVDALLDTEPNRLGEQFRASLFRHTKGYPLFTVELLRHLQERGYLVRDKDGRWTENAAFESGDLPARIEAVIEQRLSRLDPALQELLRMAAVEGEIFHAQVAAHVQQSNERLVLQQLSKLGQDHWLVREHSETQVGQQYLNRYQFSHALFQRYLYRHLSQGERRLLHTAVAETLAGLYQPQAAEIAVQLAHHYSQAGVQTQAAAYHLMAGDRARQGAALEAAIDYYRAALAGMAAEDEAGRAETLRKLGECLWMTGQTAAALEVFEVCYDLFERLGNRMGAGAVQRLIGRLYWEQGERAISLQHYHQALNILESEPESLELAQALSSVSQMHMLASEYEPAIAWGERALDLAKRLDAKEVVVHASNNIGASLATSANPERGLALLRESLQQALTLNMPHEACRAYINLGEVLVSHCRYAEAETIFEKLLAYATQVSGTLYQGAALVDLAKLDWRQGRWAAALSRCQQIRAWRDEFQGATVIKIWASTLLGRIYNDLGRPQLARRELESELRTARTHNEVLTTVPHLGQLARSIAVLALEAETAALIEEILALLKRVPAGDAYNSVLLLLFACRWVAQQRTQPESLELAGDCLRHLERIEARFHSQESAAALAEAQGVEALYNGKATLSVEQFQRAAAHWGNLSRPYDQARTLNDLGQALLRKNDPRQAQAAFKQAFGLVEILAGQLEEPELKSSFLNSLVVREIREGLSRASS